MTAMLLCAAWAQAAEPAELADQKAKVSYGIGMNLGMQWRQQEVPIDPDLLMRGMKDAMEGKATLMTEEEMRNTLTSYQNQHRAQQMEKRKLQGEQSRAQGESFLAENKTKPGVVTLPSGLQYKIIKDGQGESPSAHDQVTVNYRGTLIDGTEFDSSYKRGEPATFGVSGVIKGWTEALQLMKPGSKWELYIPSTLAYGERGSGAQIGPNSTLIFDVELISVKKQEPPPMPEPVTSDIIKVPSKEEMDKGAKIEVIKKEDLDKMLKDQQKAPQTK
ncbi:MAG: FKBP-type peptidyl-prolyl cis-trans isomerase [Verrucomicrobia bacterium]|nr:FKBP-type peptidyl-prolyl cis-trans isomerase [Verrucomicrobiota bacterium]